MLLTELPELGRSDRKAIASLAGLAPHVSQSGQAPPRAAIAGGRPCVRTALYMSALVAARHDPNLRAHYRTMRAAAENPPRSPSSQSHDASSSPQTPSSDNRRNTNQTPTSLDIQDSRRALPAARPRNDEAWKAALYCPPPPCGGGVGGGGVSAILVHGRHRRPHPSPPKEGKGTRASVNTGSASQPWNDDADGLPPRDPWQRQPMIKSLCDSIRLFLRMAIKTACL